MVFSSLTFLFLYLPLTLLVYFLAPLKWRNFILLLVSLLFYGWGEPVYIVIMFVSIAIDYTHGLLVEKYRSDDKKARWFVAQSVIFNLALLFFFKYGTFFAENLYALTGILIPKSVELLGVTIPLWGVPLPIGISFYTFQTMSYTIDVYRKDAPVQRNLVEFGTFVTMFPQLIAGPIVQYKTVAADLVHRVHTSENFALGARRFCVGLAKKVLLANSIGALWEECLAAQGAGTLTVLGGWLGLAAYGFQIYFDFSGYSDMAVGLGRMLGFEFLPNFDHPYISRSITEFWRRWHISLSTWFREYLYIPLGGNRCSKGRWIFNLFVVWAATGIWHGASWNYVIWGLYFFVLLLVEKLWLGRLLEKLPRVIQHIYTLFFVLVSWAIFALEDFGQLGAYLKVMFGMGGVPLTDGTFGYYLTSYLPILCAAAVASTNLGRVLYGKLRPRAAQAVCAVLVILGLVICTGYLVDGTYNPFLYFRF